jgi:hypothetical protein
MSCFKTNRTCNVLFKKKQDLACPVFGLYITNRVLFEIFLMTDSSVLGGSNSP